MLFCKPVVSDDSWLFLSKYELSHLNAD